MRKCDEGIILCNVATDMHPLSSSVVGLTDTEYNLSDVRAKPRNRRSVRKPGTIQKNIQS
jgi:hypothetical protein